MLYVSTLFYSLLLLHTPQSTFKMEKTPVSRPPAAPTKNTFVYAFSEVAKWPVAYLWLSKTAVCAFAVHRYWAYVNMGGLFSTTCCLFLLLELDILLLVLIRNCTKNRAVKKQQLSLAHEVIAQNPGIDLEKWDSIARAMNDLLYRGRLWHTRQCFFNGANCYEHFRSHMYLPLVKSEGGDAERDPLLHSAARVYEKDLQAYWEAASNLNTSTAEKGEDLKLPKQVYWSKLTFIAKRALSWSNVVYCIYFFFYLGVAGGLSYAAFCYLLAYYGDIPVTMAKLRVEQRLTFMKTVMRQEPQDDTQEWESVTKTINGYFSDQKLWRNREFFFDEKDCHRMFDMITRSILSVKKSKSNTIFPELIPFARESRTVCGCSVEQQV
ncbi:LANO_0F05160g1_1 [Lachancea nothofagi CBS 11611]|uniref:LANO_0F05160g1_1 n=1 Tax=Lachancea nothofagi CBS 11611 TaxID=1266666 RepID=A0A1G4K840_9SACH|nr:LANO_0F05160g1_1 [Lachancea nothofagi CBS 11611]